MLTKVCTKCKVTNKLEDFIIDCRRKDGKGSHCRKCNASYCRIRHNTNKDVPWAYKLQYNFNLTISDYNQILFLQDNKCAICLKEEIIIDNRTNKVKRLAVDHNHTTGKVRGLLCGNCNVGLGKFKEDLFNLQSAYKYISRFTND